MSRGTCLTRVKMSWHISFGCLIDSNNTLLIIVLNSMRLQWKSTNKMYKVTIHGVCNENNLYSHWGNRVTLHRSFPKTCDWSYMIRTCDHYAYGCMANMVSCHLASCHPIVITNIVAKCTTHMPNYEQQLCTCQQTRVEVKKQHRIVNNHYLPSTM